MPAIGIGMAVSTVVGKAIGQGQPDHARRLARLGVTINAAYMSSMAVLYALGGAMLMGLFSREAAVITLGAELLMFAAMFQFFDAFAITYSSALRGAGDTLWPSFVAACEAWGIMGGGGALAVWLWPEWGSRGPWLFATVFVICVGLTLWLRWRLGPWEQFDVIGRGERAEAEALAVPGMETLVG